MAMTSKVHWTIELFGDGRATVAAMSISTSPVFAGSVALDSPRNWHPTGVVIVDVSGGPDSYRPPITTKEITHRPMIDGMVERPFGVLDKSGVQVVGEDGTPTIVMVARPTRVEGPEVTVMVDVVGDAPPLPTMTASVSDGVLMLGLSEPIRDGESIGIVGFFTYDIGEKQ